MKITKNFFLILLLLVFVSGNFVFAGREMGSTDSPMGEEGSTIGEEARHGLEIKESPPVDITPPIEFIHPSKNQKVSAAIEIEVRVEGATEVNFYLLRSGSLTSIYIGKGGLGDNTWSYLWDTSNTPNGNYQLFAGITNQYGIYQSQKIKVIVNNIIEESVGYQERAQELEEIAEQIQEKETSIDEKVNQVKEEIIEEASTLIETAKEEIKGDKEKVEVELDMEKKKTESIVGNEIKEIAKSIQEESQLEKEIAEILEVKERSEEKIKEKEEELKELEELGLPGIAEEKIEEIQKEKKAIIEKYQKQRDEAKGKIEQRQERLSEIGAQKELKKQEIIKESLKPLEIVKERVDDHSKSKILELQAGVAEKIEGKIEKLEKEITKEEKSKGELKKEMLKDSDGDGLPDFLEIELGTDLLNPDSDGDGYLDGQEVALGFDALKPSVEDKIIYQDPRKIKPKKEDIFVVERAEIKISEVTQRQVLRIEGKGLPNVFITLYIYSLPTVVVTKTDAYGRWVYEFDKPLSPGEHEIYVVLTSNKGEITARSEAFNFVKSGANILRLIPEVWAEETGKGMEEVASPYDILRRSFIVLTLAAIVLALGIALLAIGFLSKRKESIYFSSKKENFSSKK